MISLVIHVRDRKMIIKIGMIILLRVISIFYTQSFWSLLYALVTGKHQPQTNQHLGYSRQRNVFLFVLDPWSLWFGLVCVTGSIPFRFLTPKTQVFPLYLLFFSTLFTILICPQIPFRIPARTPSDKDAASSQRYTSIGAISITYCSHQAIII